jgi:Uma2 family endonuclease
MPLHKRVDPFQVPPPTGSSLAALPTMYDLPSEDPEEPGLPDAFHIYQPQLLRDTFSPPRYPAERVFVATDMNLYYDLHHPLWHKRPNWFAVLGVPHFYDGHDLRLSYVIWQERVSPYLVIELLSPGTEPEDLGRTRRTPDEPPTKWEVYEQILGVPYYVVFSRYTDSVQYFSLAGGTTYREVTADDQRLGLPEAGLGLGLWSGTYQGLERQWLRFYDADGRWMPTPVEQADQRAEQADQRAEQERQRAEQAHQRAEQERQRAERLAAQLKALGIEPEP